MKVTYQLPKGLTAQHAPANIPAVFNNEKTILYAVLRQKQASKPASGEGVAKLTGVLLGKPLEYCVKFSLDGRDGVGSSSVAMVHHLAAKSLLKEWREEGEKKKKEIISLSVESNVVTEYTAYIAIDENQQKPIEGALQTWDLSATTNMPAGMRGGRVARRMCFAAAPMARGGVRKKGKSVSNGKGYIIIIVR